MKPLAKNINNQMKPMKEEIIQIEVDGVEVDGKVAWIPTDFSVEILKPYSGLKRYGDHILCIVAPYRNYMQRELRTERAREILTGLYKTAQRIEKNKGKLNKGLEQTQQRFEETDEEHIDRETWLAGRRVLRKRLRAGEMSQKEYQKKLKVLKAKHEAWEKRNEQRLQRFLSDIPRGNSTQGVLEKIENRDNEKKEED
jgi:hypothetical protein